MRETSEATATTGEDASTDLDVTKDRASGGDVVETVHDVSNAGPNAPTAAPDAAGAAGAHAGAPDASVPETPGAPAAKVAVTAASGQVVTVAVQAITAPGLAGADANTSPAVNASGKPATMPASGQPVSSQPAPGTAGSVTTSPKPATTAAPATPPEGAPQGNATVATAPAPAAPATPANPATPATPAANANHASPQEKSAGPPAGTADTSQTGAEKNFLDLGKQGLAGDQRGSGTGVALRDETMKPVPQPAARSAVRLSGRSALDEGAAGEGSGDSRVSISWKGWTNGGGEPVSTAAQFSRLNERGDGALAFGLHATASATARSVAAPVVAASAPAAAPFPADPAALTAPISAAIERLVLRGQEQLSLKVRFEQGGTLSLKLSLHEGRIATEIQTDVPGLAQALRSAWGNLADDCSGRGLKLGSPTFTSNTADAEAHPDARQGHAFARDLPEDPAVVAGRTGGARVRFGGGNAPAASSLPAAPGTARAFGRRYGATGLHTWA